MKLTAATFSAAAIALSAAILATQANAAAVLCQDTSVNHMNVDSAFVSTCLESGVGNIGNGKNDDFLNGASGSGWVDIADAGFDQSGNSGTFSLASSLWDNWDSLAIGFKFGTGNNPDEWFVYSLQQDVSAGTWDFVNVFGPGGGLSHAIIYGSGRTTSVPEPATLGLMGLSLLGFAASRRRKQS